MTWLDDITPRRYRWVAIATLLFASCAMYAGTLDLDFFLLDDRDYVVKNPWIKNLTLANLRHILSEPYFANYSPLHILSYSLDHLIGGDGAFIYHLSNCLWGGAAACLVYVLALRLLRSHAAAVFAGALFVAHPAHVEAIAWISSRKDLVATVFGLAGMLAYLRYRDCGSSKWYVAALALYLLAVAGKLSVVVLPVLLLAHDWLVERRRGRAPLLDKIPFGVIGATFALVVMRAQPPTRYSPDAYVIGHTFAHNLGLLTGFGKYVIYREQADPGAAGWWKAALMLLPGVAMLAPLALIRLRATRAMALIYWILIALIPPQVLSFVHPICDRYLFLPSVGMVILIALGAQTLARRLATRSQRTAMAGVVFAAVALLCAWSWATLSYISEWRDPRSVWFGAARKSTDPNVFQYLGSHYQDAADRIASYLAGGSLDLAQESALASRLYPGEPRFEELNQEWRNQQRGRATADHRMHLLDLAWAEFERATLQESGWLRPKLYLRRGKLQADRGKLVEAQGELLKAYEQSRLHTSELDSIECATRSLHALGIVAMRRGEFAQAISYLQRAEREQLAAGRVWVTDLAQQRSVAQQKLDAARGSGK